MSLKKKVAMGLTAMVISTSFTSVSFAASDIEAEIAQQQQILNELNEKRSKLATEEMQQKLNSLEEAISYLRKNSSNSDVEGTVAALADQLYTLREEFASQNALYERLADTLDALEAKMSRGGGGDYPVGHSHFSDDSPQAPDSTRFLVNPGPNRQVSYTQDAVNSQGNSTMNFAYSPSQLYKIYCRQGFITDIELKKGETVNFVGGGDTAGWSVTANTVDGTPHVYIKPVVDSSTTNIIITTNKHSYNLLVNTSDWYNPIIRWTYNAEDTMARNQAIQREEQLVTGSINTNPQNLDFNYSWRQKNTDIAPNAVFSDGKQTFIKFDRSMGKAPIIFMKGRGKDRTQMVNYKIKDHCIIVDAVFDEAELRISDTEYLTIKHKK